MDTARRQGGGADTCLYGSVVGMDALLALDGGCAEGAALSASHGSGAESPLSCDECEQAQARIECEDCGLVYCPPCDAHRHRKGKLLFHQRKKIAIASVVSTCSTSSSSPQSFSLLQRQEEQQQHESAVSWSVDQVGSWLKEHDLELFVSEIAEHSINGAFLLSPQMEAFLESHSSAGRGQKKKLLREIQKLKADSFGWSGSSSITKSSLVVTPMKNAVVSAGAGEFQVQQQQQQSAMRRVGVNLRVNVNTSPASTSSSEQSFSPVTSLRSRVNHGQGDDAKGRIHRRRSAANPSSPAATPDNKNPSLKPSMLSINTTDEPKRSKSVLFAPSQLRIDVQDTALLGVETENQNQAPRQETRPSGRTDLRSMRQALGGLDLDIVQVKREERAVEASFDFSAEGRLQTQGFEINTHGIANVPFPHQHASKKAALGTREYLLILNELGHGAGGKVYKALYIPTFKLLAVKVIRVYDQKKRHQMVRELKSLYVNFVPINDTASKAACEELVVFYDAYTNPEIGSVSIVLEFMNGGSLEDHLQSGRRVSERELANMACCVLKGLAFLHEHHQLHRDIKLSNMLINNEGQVKISDFGISRDLESTLAKATTFTGTLLYMAPERISGGMYSYPSDIWSFGLAIMALAVGKLPVPTKEGYWGVVHAVQEQPSPKLSDYGDRFSPALCDFIDQCLQKNPMYRPPAATLLEHAFIRENYSPRGVQGRSFPFGAEGSGHGEDSEKNVQELEHMAAKMRTWCQNHADTLLSPTSAASSSGGSGGEGGALFQQIPNRVRIASLAQQLHLPVEQVASKFSFLDEYCK